MGTWKIVACATLAGALAAGARAQVACENVAGVPPNETRVAITIEQPAEGAVIAPTSACSTEVVVSGRYTVTAPSVRYDFYVVLDMSGSTDGDSRGDVNGNGVLGERADSIYQAEVAAAQAFVRALDPALSRVAVISFNRNATLRQALTADLVAADATLESMKSLSPRWGTGYLPAMDAVKAEVLARGDVVNRKQRCIFLSDGQPDESLSQVDAKAAELAAIPLVMDTFALGFPDSAALQDMASITGGRFTALMTPGDIVALLPSFVGDAGYTMSSRNDVTSGSAAVITDEAAGTFEARVTLVPGANHVTLTLTAESDPPTTVECAIDVVLAEALVADAGPAQASCDGFVVILDGSGSSVGPCTAPVYRWLDCDGAEVCPPSSAPTCAVTPVAGCDTYRLEVTCAGEGCSSQASTTVTVVTVPRPEPSVVRTCGLTADVTCGSADPSLQHAWDLDPLVDADGNGVTDDDADVAGCDATATWPGPGTHRIVALSRDPASGCTRAAYLTATVRPPPPTRNLDGGLCPGIPALLSCGSAEPGSSYWWDLDGATDSDLDGDPTNDADAAGCEVTTSWTTEGLRQVWGWVRDASGCTFPVAEGNLDVSAGAAPGEASGLRVYHAAAAASFSWDVVPGASSYRVLRGTLASLHADRTYDHLADPEAGAGTCDTSGSGSHQDPDDGADGGDYYYLVTALNPCGGEGPAGSGWDGHAPTPIPGRRPSALCP